MERPTDVGGGLPPPMVEAGFLPSSPGGNKRARDTSRCDSCQRITLDGMTTDGLCCECCRKSHAQSRQKVPRSASPRRTPPDEAMHAAAGELSPEREGNGSEDPSPVRREGGERQTVSGRGVVGGRTSPTSSHRDAASQVETGIDWEKLVAVLGDFVSEFRRVITFQQRGALALLEAFKALWHSHRLPRQQLRDIELTANALGTNPAILSPYTDWMIPPSSSPFNVSVDRAGAATGTGSGGRTTTAVVSGWTEQREQAILDSSRGRSLVDQLKAACGSASKSPNAEAAVHKLDSSSSPSFRLECYAHRLEPTRKETEPDTRHRDGVSE
eukprot:GHVU01193382.1.p1 GENE.GHVU01193382.1~~GHVU01193382.1.p1  ORF type:complete len:328 (+),score=33.55 GHVU01193382.1:249-1232(+)